MGKFAIFNGYGDGVDIYDTSLTHTTNTEAPGRGYSQSATTVGDYAIFGELTEMYAGSDGIVSAYVLI